MTKPQVKVIAHDPGAAIRMDIKLDTFKKRRPLDDDDPHGYLESDRDLIDNNFELVLEILKAICGEK